jgi:hypothetical protein
MVDNLIICRSAIIHEHVDGYKNVVDTYDEKKQEAEDEGSVFRYENIPKSELEAHIYLDPCGDPPYTYISFRGAEQLNNWLQWKNWQIQAGQVTEDVEAELMIYPDAVSCAARCKDHPQCDMFEYFPEEHYNEEEPDCNKKNYYNGGGTCKKWAGACYFRKYHECGDDASIGPWLVKDETGHPLRVSVPGDTPVAVVGFKPDAEWKSKITECPFGDKMVIEADAETEASSATTAAP